MHFHWGSKSGSGSEHGVGGQFYDLEIHLIHYLDSYDSFMTALLSKDRKALTVLSILAQVSQSEEPNPGLTQILEAIDLVTLPSNESHHYKLKGGSAFSLLSLLPRSLDFYRYQGSLTTPPCSEIVSWVVFCQPIPISEEQLNQFRKANDGHDASLSDNYRPTQPIGGREVRFLRVGN